MIMRDQFLLHTISSCFMFQSMNQLRNEAVLSSYPVIHMLLTTSFVSNIILMTRPFSISKICSSIHHIGVYLLIICSFDLCEYNRMLLLGKQEHSRPCDHVPFLTVSLSHKIHLFHWFIRWRFCICIWPIRPSLF